MTSRSNISKALVAALLLPCAAFAATSASHDNITISWSGELTVGSWQDGSKYIVAPSGVTITSITPAWDGQQHGAMLNLVPDTSSPYRHGFDTRYGSGMEYNAALNVADDLPLALAVGDCLVVSRGNADNGGVGRPITDFAAFYVVASAPPANSFRPPYAGTDRTVYGQTSSLDYSWLPNLADPGVSTPSSTTTQGNGFGSIYMDMIGQWPNSSLKSENGMPNYGRDLAYLTSKVALWLCLDNDNATKQQTLIDCVQQGIDIYGLRQAGMRWAPNGGHNVGRKILLGIAAKALGNSDMLAALDGDDNKFQEDAQHDYITLQDTQYTQSGDEPFTSEMLTNWNGTGGPMPEWFSNALSIGTIPDSPGERDTSGAEWGKSYRSVNGGPNVGTALAAELMGLRAAWNDEAFFVYIEERYWPTEQANRANDTVSINLFPAAMWDAYKGVDPEVPPPPVEPGNQPKRSRPRAAVQILLMDR